MPSTVVNETLKLLKDRITKLDEITVGMVILGLGYTGVELSTGHVGVCCTLQNEISTVCCRVHERAGKLAGSPAEKIAEFAKSWDLSESVVGVAAMNALSSIVIEGNQDMYAVTKGNVVDDLPLKKDDVVAFIGNMVPLITRVRKTVKKTVVFERSLSRCDVNVLSDAACEKLLPNATVAIITGTAIANGTIDRLLELSKQAREIAVVGASAGALPEVMFRHGVTVLGGIKVLDPKKLLQVVAEGGGTPQLKKAAEFINYRAKKPDIRRSMN